MRRLLSYHIVSQVGYMVCGVGIGTVLALNGAVAHAVCHILYKALLFMAVGAVAYRTGRERLSELGGLCADHAGRPSDSVHGGSACRFPAHRLFNGFVSKSLVVSAAAEAHQTLAVFLLMLASVGTFLSVGLKLPYFAWGPVGEAPERCGEAPVAMLAAMGALALLCVGLGVYPSPLYDLLPFPPVEYHPYTAYHVFEAVLVMALCGAAFWQARGLLVPHRGRTLDLDELYRRPSAWLATVLSVWLDRSSSILGARFDHARAAVVAWVRDPTSWSMGATGEEKRFYDENRSRPSVGTNLSLILAVFILVAGLLFLRAP